MSSRVPKPSSTAVSVTLLSVASAVLAIFAALA